MITVYNKELKKMGVLENAFHINTDHRINSIYLMEFELPYNDKKNELCKPFNIVEYDNVKYRIIPQTMEISEIGSIKYECEHVIATLMNDLLKGYHQIGNLGVYTEEVINYILDYQSIKHWKLGECHFSRQFEYSWEWENLLGALFSVPQVFSENYRWDFDTEKYPWTINLYPIEYNNKNIKVVRGYNNLQIVSKSSPEQLVTRIYPLGYGEGVNQLDISEVNNGKLYLESPPEIIEKYGIIETAWIDRRYKNPNSLKFAAKQMLEKLQEPKSEYEIDGILINNAKIGDRIRVIDEEKNIDFDNIIVQIKTNHDDLEQTKINIANTSESIATSIADLADRQRIETTYSQGATNIQQIQYADNAEPKFPLKLKFYIPEEMVRINKVILNYSIEQFRSYSKGNKGGGGTVATTNYEESETVTSRNNSEITKNVFTTTRSRGAGGTSDVDRYIPGPGRGHNHGIPSGTEIFTKRGGEWRWAGSFVQSGNHIHKVDIDIPPLSASGSITIPGHPHKVKIPGHGHEVKLEDHYHPPIHGIYEGPMANKCYLKVDGTTVWNYDTEVDIIDYLEKDDSGRIQRGTWHEIEIIPDRLTRINASLFLQIFVNSRGGGSY